jgi:coenzyme F420-reducing hydrogenase alpha subunit
MARRTIIVDTLARVEGEGALDLTVRDGQVTEARLRIYEPPRFFEAFLRGRDFREAPDITSRICGICPIAYIMSACRAMEQVCGVTLDPGLETLRRLIYCGEWIESHALHVHLLHLPDFLDCQDAVEVAKTHPEPVRRGLRLKKLGNELMRVVGGREIHPVNLKVGGFYRLPDRERLEALVPELEWAVEAATETVQFLAGLEFPDYQAEYEYLSLHTPERYAIESGRLRTSSGVELPVDEYDTLLQEEHTSHSTALHSRLHDGGLAHLGPLARYNINHAQLTPRARAAAEAAGLGPVCRNPFRSILVRSVEILLAFEEALRLLQEFEAPAAPAAEVLPQAGTGFGATEAPRGICYHRYSIDQRGVIEDAKIVAPTSVNQKIIEADLAAVAQANLALSDEELRWRCEQTIRNYDPCISCSTHFLDLRVDRG